LLVEQDEIRAEAVEFAPTPPWHDAEDVDRWAKELDQWAEATYLRSAVDEVVKNPTNEAAVRSITAVAALDSRVDSLEVTAQVALPAQSPAAQAVTASFTGVVNSLKAKIQSLLNQVWHLISNLFTPTGWSVGGDTGFNFLGLQGNLALQINFGQ